mmetsp:Transcript_12389/g.35970  ORF Transcript_12389/g.35970 Transcript_12389/m.35970 type:complete len:96 (-) Transcript_12389:121-408(-)
MSWYLSACLLARLRCVVSSYCVSSIQPGREGCQSNEDVVNSANANADSARNQEQRLKWHVSARVRLCGLSSAPLEWKITVPTNQCRVFTSSAASS